LDRCCIDIGRVPQPLVIVHRPVVLWVQETVRPAPVGLHLPPGATASTGHD